jgi:hypothetical protein
MIIPPNSRFFVDEYPLQACQTPASFFEVVCGQNGKFIMPPLNIELCTSSLVFFKRAFSKMRPYVQQSQAIPLTDEISDEDAFEICFLSFERPPLFSILLVIPNLNEESEVFIDHSTDQAIDWHKVKKGIIVCNYGDKLKLVLRSYAKTLVKL